MANLTIESSNLLKEELVGIIIDDVPSNLKRATMVFQKAMKELYPNATLILRQAKDGEEVKKHLREVCAHFIVWDNTYPLKSDQTMKTDAGIGQATEVEKFTKKNPLMVFCTTEDKNAEVFDLKIPKNFDVNVAKNVIREALDRKQKEKPTATPIGYPPTPCAAVNATSPLHREPSVGLMSSAQAQS